MPAGIAPAVARSLWCFLSFLCGDSVVDRSWRVTQRGLERPRYKHTTLLYSLAVKVFEFPPSRRLVRVCRGKFVRSSEPSGDFALTGRSPRVSLLLDKLLSPKSLLSDSHPSVSKPSSRIPGVTNPVESTEVPLVDPTGTEQTGEGPESIDSRGVEAPCEGRRRRDTESGGRRDAVAAGSSGTSRCAVADPAK